MISGLKNQSHQDFYDQCGECGSNDLLSDESRGDLICRKCGLILESNTIDQGAEWRAFNSNEINKKAKFADKVPCFCGKYEVSLGNEKISSPSRRRKF